MENIIYEKDKQVAVTGNAKDKKGAFADALNKIAKEVVASESDLVFKIEPKSFEVEHLKEISTKEHFLFFFFPRIRTSYEVKLNALVHLECAAVENVSCQKVDVNDNDQFRRIMKGV